jgi:hypothetical protein
LTVLARFYGGLGILNKNNLRPGVKILMNTNKDYQWLKLDKQFFFIFNLFDTILILDFVI